MEKYKKLFVYIISLVFIYYILTKFSFLAPSYFDIPTRKIIKGIIGLTMAMGAFKIYHSKKKINRSANDKN